jgi:hypothetical protein
MRTKLDAPYCSVMSATFWVISLSLVGADDPDLEEPQIEGG